MRCEFLHQQESMLSMTQIFIYEAKERELDCRSERCREDLWPLRRLVNICCVSMSDCVNKLLIVLGSCGQD